MLQTITYSNSRHFLKGRKKTNGKVNGSSVATHAVVAAPMAPSKPATLCPYAHNHCSLNTYVVSIYYVYPLPTVHSSCAMPIHMQAIAQRLRAQLPPSAPALSTSCFYIPIGLCALTHHTFNTSPYSSFYCYATPPHTLTSTTCVLV
jgi:hypothetical protein